MVRVSEAEMDRLLSLAREKSEAGRRALIATVADLFFAHGQELNDRERSLMTEILRHLVHDVEVAVRRALAERLANEPDAPHDLAVALANDVIEVAHPILLHSDVLQDVELIEIIRHRTFEHQLAIATRRDVSEAVSEALVDAGHEDVISALLNNANARISAGTMNYLVEQASRVDTFQNPLLRRADLSPDLAKRMYWWVGAALRQHILDRYQIDESTLEEHIDLAVSGLIENPAPAAPRTASALAEPLMETANITPQFLLRVLRQGEVALFEALFIRVSGIRPTLVRRILFEPGSEGLAIACKALDFPPDIFAAIAMLSRRSRQTGGNPARGEIGILLDLYAGIERKAAQQLVSKWRRSSSFVNAVWRTERPRLNHATS